MSINSICHLDARRKPGHAQADRGAGPAQGAGAGRGRGRGKTQHWARPEAFEAAAAPIGALVHILSPFDPLIIQRKRLQLFFGYDHRFEAYVPKEKRVFGYFALPVLVGDEIVAAHRPQDRPREGQAADPAMDLGRRRLGAGRTSG